MPEDGFFGDIGFVFTKTQARDDGVATILRDASFQRFDGSDVGVKTADTTTVDPADSGGLADLLPGDEFWL
ncbi:hypothetical protein KUW09_06445 [Mameliella alba]|nr:hypothetical protein [Antarctobacter heliothermus]MBY6143674.1 hypothetical protein [Mameliella alba]MCA0952602.1 hypothetical protein [Mameliella alba]